MLEAFHPNQLSYSSGGPKDENLLYSSNMLQDDFNLLTIQQLEEVEIQLNEGAYHSGAGYVTRMVAQKQAAV